MQWNKYERNEKTVMTDEASAFWTREKPNGESKQAALYD